MQSNLQTAACCTFFPDTNSTSHPSKCAHAKTPLMLCIEHRTWFACARLCNPQRACEFRWHLLRVTALFRPSLSTEAFQASSPCFLLVQQPKPPQAQHEKVLSPRDAATRIRTCLFKRHLSKRHPQCCLKFNDIDIDRKSRLGYQVIL